MSQLPAMSDAAKRPQPPSASWSPRRLTLLALLFALAICLSYVESLLPPPPVPAPGFKYGLGNVVILYAFFFLRFRDAFILVFLKGLYTLLFRGLIAALLSLTGGLLAAALSALLLWLFQERISTLLLSVLAAIAHNLGQFTVISIIYRYTLQAFIPLLLLSGLVGGALSATCLHASLRALGRLPHPPRPR